MKAPKYIPGFENRLNLFICGVRRMLDSHNKEYKYVKKSTLIRKDGWRYIKLILDNDGVQRTWAFIDKSNGDIYAPINEFMKDSQVRGSIFNKKNGLKDVTVHGPRYA